MKMIEALFWLLGGAMLLLVLSTHTWGEIERQQDISAFAHGPTQTMQIAHAGSVSVTPSPARNGEILAVLRIDEVGINLPVRFGTDSRVLRRSPGLIEGTAFPGEAGNVAIAAHRDRHFRGLQDVDVGTLIELETHQGTQAYIVTKLAVVDATDVHILEDVGRSVLTLVTCYPFYFLGNGAQRFIVRAEANGMSH